jgi:hypothetical protein
MAEINRAEMSVARREQNIRFVISRYANDRLLALLEVKPDAERALEVARSLSADFDHSDPTFRWLEAANDLLSGLPHATNFSRKPAAFDLAQFQELERRAAAFAEACIYASNASKEAFLASLRLASSETPEAATQRIFLDSHSAMVSLLIEELQSEQSNFYWDNVEFKENAPNW